MISLSFTIPGPPQPKERPRLGKNGRVYTPRSTRSYELRGRTYALQARAAAGWTPGRDDRYRVRLVVVFPDNRRRDLDNATKAVLDAGNQMLWQDDSQIVELHVFREVDPDRPRVDVVVTRLDAKPTAPKPPQSRRNAT